MKRFLPALTLVVLIVSSAPFVGLIRDLLFDRFEAAAVRGIALALLSLAACVFLYAIFRIRDHRLSRYGGLALAALLLWLQETVLSAGITDAGLASRVSVVEKIHLVEYGLLAYLLYRAFKPAGDLTMLLLPLLWVTVAGVADESMQWLVETRLGEIRDVLLNAYAVPLLARGECLGCLYLAGRAGALRLDASDLLLLKAVAGQLAAALDRAELAARESARLRAELEALRTGLGENQIVHRSPRMAALMATARRVAPTDATVLVTGASGTGKELVARMVHALSPRRGKPAVVVDCGAISASLIDSELFGHEKGAYSGAAGRSAGRLAEAAGSTVILDEIGELPLEAQSKLLRFVQEREIIAVGGTRPRTVDARLVAVTHRDLADEVAAGRFREDLYYRLNVIHLEVPALVERPEDVPILIDHFARRFAARYCKDVRGLSPEAAALAARYPWPGNVRELENRILQAVILSEGEEIGPEDLELDVAAARAAGARPAGAETMDLDLGGVEKRHIERVLASEGSSMARAARRLGIHRSTLYEKVRKYGIERPD